MTLPPALRVPSRIVSYQFVLMGGLVLLGALTGGGRTGLALLMGGLSAWLPSCWFVRVVFSRFLTPGGFFTLFVAAETGRILLSAALFVLAITRLSMDVVPVGVGFVAVMGAFWVSSLFCLGRKTSHWEKRRVQR